MSELHTVESLDRQPFKYMVATIGNLPTSFVDSMSYYELLAWLCQYLQEKVIPAVNNNAEALDELQAKFIELKTYVDNYFENLDVQEEINNKLDEMADDGSLAEIVGEYLFYFWVSPKSYGAVLDGETDDTAAVEEALSHGSVKFPPNCNVRLENLEIPSYRIIDFNNANISSETTAIKIGSLSDETYNKKITIKNGSFDVGTNAIELIQSIFVNIENCYLPELKNGNKFISMTNCFNVYIEKCSVGDYTPSLVANTNGVYINTVSGAAIVGTNNTTNVRITDTLIQRVETGINLNVTNGLIDTVLIDNCGFSDVDCGISIPTSYTRNVVVNCLRCELSRLVVSNYGRININGLESYSNEKCLLNRGQMYLNGNVDFRGSGVGIDSTASLYIITPIAADNDITHSITYAEKPYNVYPVDNTGVPNAYISPVQNYNINQTGDFNLADLTTEGVPYGSELTLNSQNGFTIHGFNCDYNIPERGCVRLKRLTNWCVEMLGAKIGSAPTAGTNVTINASKVKIIGSMVVFNYDITTSATIDANASVILSGLPQPLSTANYGNIGSAGVAVTTNGDLKTWYGGDLAAGTYRGCIVYSI